MILGITMGDSSGVGPEIIPHAFARSELRHHAIVFGDLAVLDYCNRRLGYQVPLRVIDAPAAYQDGYLNVIDFGLIAAQDITPGIISRKFGAAARSYVELPPRAALP